MEMELILRKANKDGSGLFIIPAIFFKDEFVKSFANRLEFGKTYRLTIEEVKQ